MLNSIVKIALLEPKGKKHIFKGIACTFFFKVFEIAPDLLYGLMIDTTLHKKRSFLFKKGFSNDLSTIYILAGMILIAWIGNICFQFFSSLQWKHAARVIQYRLRMDLCLHILNQEKFSVSKENETLQDNHRSTNDEIETVEIFINKTADEFFKILFSCLIIGPILFCIASEFLLYALIPLPPTIMLALYLQKRIRPLYNSVKKATRDMYREIDELINGISIIKDFGIEDRIYKRIEAFASCLNQTNKKTSYLNSALVPLTKIFIQLGLLGILIHGVIMVFHGHVSFGAFAATTFLSRKFLLPFSFLGGLIDSFLKGAYSAKSVLTKIEKNKIRVYEQELLEQKHLASIKIKDLNYSYGNRKLFHNVNFEFKSGCINVIKGQTGAGKTTLFRLLMREFSMDSGTIFYGSQEVSHYSNSSWREKIAFVPQHPKLFTATILENITLFANPPNMLALEQAIEVSLTSQFVKNLPKGLHSVVGPHGLSLSGGQIQSIAIARALYSEAQILLLDEPTAGFDLEREQLFLQALKTTLKGKMVIITSHHPHTIEAADSVFELQD